MSGQRRGGWLGSAGAGSGRHSQQPVDGDDERHVLGGQAHRVQHHHHGDEARLRDAGRSDTRRRRRDAATRPHPYVNIGVKEVLMIFLVGGRGAGEGKTI